MLGLMQEVPLSIPMLVRRARDLFPDKHVVSRRPDRSIGRAPYGDVIARSGRLALALRALGVAEGDRVATLAWNHQRHLEAYFAVPSMGAVLHTLNLRLHPTDLAYIIGHAEDQVILVDQVLWPLWEKVAPLVRVKHVIIMSDGGETPPGAIDYEALLSGSADDTFQFDDRDERTAAAMCYTSGTTGRPKGVLYSHRAIVLHTFMSLASDSAAIVERDVMLPVVPMFHVNAWGFPYTTAFVGATQVHPGPHLDPASLLELMSTERVTMAAGVPTIWLGILQALDAAPGHWDLSAMRMTLVGGAAPPESMIRGFKQRHGVVVQQGWGMTEMSPIGSVSRLQRKHDDIPEHEQYHQLAKAGYPVPGVEIRARSESGLLPWDGTSMGELEVRGPWVVREYYRPEDPITQFTDDGWFRTGDIVTIAPDGCITITDRSKDVIKSGGEWVSSVALEGALMGHAEVFEAAVVGLPHPRWSERPFAVVVRKPGALVEAPALKAWLAERFASWWVPDDFAFVDALPKTGTGKVQKSQLRDTYRDRFAGADEAGAAHPPAEAGA
ncbi:MAG: long-chain fatty acid--CoA ligase [Gemmatimonadetes bacterium]|nr:long-chain fatty acid--CoA ligase [Gemmatimonadota bacterium]MCC6773717.1 long-chain fatty acid--CoA ligase [Gemmatimonadaceae bacterium]